ncbi:MAG: MmcB family DNA repair protein [Acetobacteraceae bacterium]|nr:MmcB family DNA repair protein [Acetobacteraceae bacterium]
MNISLPDRSLAIRRAAARLCGQLAWAPLHEVPLPNGRRADILALGPDCCFTCIEVKSGVRDFLADDKWPDYRAFCDALYFAVDAEFPHAALLPPDVGLIVADDRGADILRAPDSHPMAPARRRALLHRFAMLAANRLQGIEDPAGQAAARAALRPE